MEITLSNRQKILKIAPARVKARAKKILNALECPEAELSLVLVDDTEIARLNGEYLQREGPTNVISFPMREGDFAGINPDLLGDVVISVETAVREAGDADLTPEEMLDFYLIHGILHLVGYDHERPEADAEAMEAKTRELWAMLGHEPRHSA